MHGGRLSNLQSLPSGSPAPGVAGLTREDAWLTAGVALLAVLFQLPIFDRWIGLLDEGYILAIADDINRGQVLYRDVTIDAPFPGAFHLLAWWFRVAGTSVLASRVLALAGFAVFVAALFRIARSLLPRAYCAGVVAALLAYRVWAFPHWQIYSYTLVAATFCAVAVAVVLSALDGHTAASRRGSGTWWRLILAGLCIGCAVASKQNTGLAVGGALGLALLVLPWLAVGPRPRLVAALAPAAAFGLAIVVVLIPTFTYFASQGALDEMLHQTLLFTVEVMQRASYTRLPALWPLLGQDAALRAEIGSYFPAILATLWWHVCPGCWVSDMSRGHVYQQTGLWDAVLKLVYWAPIGVTLVAAAPWCTGIARRRLRGEAPAQGVAEIVLLAFAGGALLGFSPPRDWTHLMMVYPPCIVVAAVLSFRVARALPPALRMGWNAALAASVAALLLVSLALMDDLRRRIDFPLDTPRGGVYVDRSNGPIIEDVLAYVQREVPPGEPAPAFPMLPMLTFLADRETSGGYHVIWPFQAESRDLRIIDDLEKRHVERVIYSLSQYAHLRSFQTNAPRLFDHLVENFEIDEVFTREPYGPLLAALRRRAPTRDDGATPLRALVSSDAASWRRWPFGEVLTQAIGTPGAPRPLRLALTVPREMPYLSLDFGVNPDRWLGLESGPFVFSVSLDAGGGAPPRELLRRQVDPRELADRGWKHASLDLSDVAGEAVELVFSIATAAPDAHPDDLAGWREPTFVSAAGRRS